MQFVIIAYDGKDENALERRMSVRPRHLENMAKVREAGNVISAGGLLNDEGTMIGSYLIMEYNNREELDAYLKTEPYVTGNVWQEIKIERCNVVVK